MEIGSAWRGRSHERRGRGGSEEMTDIITLDHVEKVYRRDALEIPVLKDITLGVPEGAASVAAAATGGVAYLGALAVLFPDAMAELREVRTRLLGRRKAAPGESYVEVGTFYGASATTRRVTCSLPTVWIVRGTAGSASDCPGAAYGARGPRTPPTAPQQPRTQPGSAPTTSRGPDISPSFTP